MVVKNHLHSSSDVQEVVSSTCTSMKTETTLLDFDQKPLIFSSSNPIDLKQGLESFLKDTEKYKSLCHFLIFKMF
jgi:hypothetical protein